MTKIESRSWICRKPATLASALIAVASAAEALAQHRNVFKGTQFDSLVNNAIQAGGRSKQYFTEYFGQSISGGEMSIPQTTKPLANLAAVKADLEMFVTVIEDAQAQTQLRGVKSLQTVLTSAIEQAKVALKQFAGQPSRASSNRLPGQTAGSEFSPFAADQQPGLTLTMFAISGVNDVTIGIAQQLLATVAKATQPINYGAPQMDTLDVDLGQGIQVQFRSAQSLALFGNETMLCQKLATEIAEFVPQFDSLGGADTFGSNQHQVILRFTNVPMTVVITSTGEKALTEYNPAEFFELVAKALEAYAPGQIPSTTEFPYIQSAWGSPRVIGSTGRGTRTQQYQQA